MAADKKSKFIHIDHLAIDTSVLTGADWPYPGFQLEDTAQICLRLGVSLVLPELVLIEAEAVWRRHTRQAIDESRKRLGQLARRFPSMLDQDKVILPTERDCEASYERGVRDVIERWKPRIVALPDVSLQEAVTRSARHEMPFAEEDISFRDSMIAWSMLEPVKKGGVLGLLAHDKFFEMSPIRELANSRGIKLVLMKNVSDARALVTDMATATRWVEVIKASAEMEQRLSRALEHEGEKLEWFLRENLRVPEYAYGVDGRVEAVHSLTIQQIRNVHVQLPFEKHEPDASADILVKVDVTLVPASNQVSPRTLLIGGSTSDAPPIYGTFESVRSELDALAALRLKVDWPETGTDLPGIEYVGVEFVTQAQRELEWNALREALSDSDQDLTG